MNLFQKIRLIIFILSISTEKFKKTQFKQRVKGFEKYGKYLSDCDLNDYNWETMALEEIVDCNEYLGMLELFKKDKIKK